MNIYKCLECGNVDRFEELNVIKTSISQDNNYMDSLRCIRRKIGKVFLEFGLQ